MQETSNKDHCTVVKAMKQNMNSTATTAFKIIAEEVNLICNDIEIMSTQADEMNTLLSDTSKQVNAIFESLVTQQGGINKPKREHSRSILSRSTSTNLRRIGKWQQ